MFDNKIIKETFGDQRPENLALKDLKRNIKNNRNYLLIAGLVLSILALIAVTVALYFTPGGAGEAFRNLLADKQFQKIAIPTGVSLVGLAVLIGLSTLSVVCYRKLRKEPIEDNAVPSGTSVYSDQNEDPDYRKTRVEEQVEENGEKVKVKENYENIEL